MLRRFLCALPRPTPPYSLFIGNTNTFRTYCCMKCKSGNLKISMGSRYFHPKSANLRLCNVSSYNTELLEICADDPTLHVLFIPGNPGVIAYYKDFLESIYDLLGGTVSVTGIGHISHSRKDWAKGGLLSLQEQIDHKISFISQEMQTTDVPILLVGHSIGVYITLEMLRRCPEKVVYCIGLYPFLKMNRESSTQNILEKITKSSIMRNALSIIVASLGFLPNTVSRFLVANILGKSWCRVAVDATCSHVLQYHTMRNILFMAMTEFKKRDKELRSLILVLRQQEYGGKIIAGKCHPDATNEIGTAVQNGFWRVGLLDPNERDFLSEEPDWEFFIENSSKIAFLYGVDDHWGPMQMFEEISKKVPEIPISVERRHTHAFCCTKAGSDCVAQHVVRLVKAKVESSN